MTTMAPETEQPAGAAHCGCCGRMLPASRLTELGSTPGVFICARCALWAARRSTPFPGVRLDPRLVMRGRGVSRRADEDLPQWRSQFCAAPTLTEPPLTTRHWG
jgi:hypothetical protein